MSDDRMLSRVLDALKNFRGEPRLICANELCAFLDAPINRVTAALSKLEKLGCVGRKMAKSGAKTQFHYWYVAELPRRGTHSALMAQRDEAFARKLDCVLADALEPPPLPSSAPPQQAALGFGPSVTFQIEGKTVSMSPTSARALYADLREFFGGGA